MFCFSETQVLMCKQNGTLSNGFGCEFPEFLLEIKTNIKKKKLREFFGVECVSAALGSRYIS